MSVNEKRIPYDPALLPKVKMCFEKILGNNEVNLGLKFLADDHESTIEEQKSICSIPAPPFQEEKRAIDYMDRLKKSGLENVKMDEIGNVYGLLKGKANGPKLLVSAHLDTVFDKGTDTLVKDRDGLLCAPGIGDDTRGLAEILSIIRAFNKTQIQPLGDIVFCGNVGEEGIGDLRGIKHIFKKNTDIDGFISIDGSGVASITYLGTGSYRYKITYKGPGGHSFGSFGLPSAIHAQGRAISKIADIIPPATPKTTFTVGKVEGGTAINSIADRASMYIDIRSGDKRELKKLESTILECIKNAAEEENRRWNHKEKITIDIELIGDRPAAAQSVDNIIVQAAIGAINSMGLGAKLNGPGSTDANIPMSLGIPAIAVGRGGISGSIHTLKEWFDPRDAYLGPQKTFLTILSLVGIVNVCEPLLPYKK
ncbi:M20/M25/M40 family metallo-hydrolase [Maledivibacter halophilus]|uniref:Acetylornithine deacetylase/Succinyl-diaminopimelate desuccinylase n=1 Tax=Maledivibacter halophilus TaxID=36842 RepID=A0A1T5IT55_9FIRM|nr:M20/M25/M40 family metallo-hydrolase [Maledivibacter halophilus]SKC42351.1 Acetylornithine deacetylase/Succinyl-diaminopimelate desuccinylase [Maledivibacter halophilus]